MPGRPVNTHTVERGWGKDYYECFLRGSFVVTTFVVISLGEGLERETSTKSAKYATGFVPFAFLSQGSYSEDLRQLSCAGGFGGWTYAYSTSRTKSTKISQKIFVPAAPLRGTNTTHPHPNECSQPILISLISAVFHFINTR